MANEMDNRKILVIGLDGATWDLIKPWAEKGKLPTFKKLMKDGLWGELKSTEPPITYPAWVSFSTGRNPGKLGMAFFTSPSEYKARLAYTMQYEHIWNLLSSSGKRVGIVNVPTVSFPEKINGFVVCGVTASPSRSLTYLKSLRRS